MSLQYRRAIDILSSSSSTLHFTLWGYLLCFFFSFSEVSPFLLARCRQQTHSCSRARSLRPISGFITRMMILISFVCCFNCLSSRFICSVLSQLSFIIIIVVVLIFSSPSDLSVLINQSLRGEICSCVAVICAGC